MAKGPAKPPNCILCMSPGEVPLVYRIDKPEAAARMGGVVGDSVRFRLCRRCTKKGALGSRIEDALFTHFDHINKSKIADPAPSAPTPSDKP